MTTERRITADLAGDHTPPAAVDRLPVRGGATLRDDASPPRQRADAPRAARVVDRIVD
jgi:hypothetical protein